jgi:hypothetical protein
VLAEVQKQHEDRGGSALKYNQARGFFGQVYAASVQQAHGPQSGS